MESLMILRLETSLDADFDTEDVFNFRGFIEVDTEDGIIDDSEIEDLSDEEVKRLRDLIDLFYARDNSIKS